MITLTILYDPRQSPSNSLHLISNPFHLHFQVYRADGGDVVYRGDLDLTVHGHDLHLSTSLENNHQLSDASASGCGTRTSQLGVLAGAGSRHLADWDWAVPYLTPQLFNNFYRSGHGHGQVQSLALSKFPLSGAASADCTLVAASTESSPVFSPYTSPSYTTSSSSSNRSQPQPSPTLLPTWIPPDHGYPPSHGLDWGLDDAHTYLVPDMLLSSLKPVSPSDHKSAIPPLLSPIVFWSPPHLYDDSSHLYNDLSNYKQERTDTSDIALPQVEYLPPDTNTQPGYPDSQLEYNTPVDRQPEYIPPNNQQPPSVYDHHQRPADHVAPVPITNAARSPAYAFQPTLSIRAFNLSSTMAHSAIGKRRRGKQARSGALSSTVPPTSNVDAE